MHIKTLAILVPLCLSFTAVAACDQKEGTEVDSDAEEPTAGGKADEVDADGEPSMLGAACLYADDCAQDQYCSLMACALDGEHPTADGDLSFCYGQCADVERPRQCLPLENNTTTREWICPGDYECSPGSPRVPWSDPEYCGNTIFCSDDAECADAGEGWVCNVNGVCGEPCSATDDCQAGERCRVGICLAGMERADTPPSVSIPVLLDNPDYFDGRNVSVSGYPVLDGAKCTLEFEGTAVEILAGTLSECVGSRHRIVHGPVSLDEDGVPAVTGGFMDSICSPNPANWSQNRSC